MRIPISMVENVFNIYLPMDIEKRIQKTGFFCSKEKEFISFDPASNRPDTNSIAGILKEIAIALDIPSYETGIKNIITEHTDLVPKEIDALCILKMKNISDISEELKKCLSINNIKVTDQYKNLANALTVFTGIPFICIPECTIDEIELYVIGNDIKIKIHDEFFIWGDYGGCRGSRYFLALVVPPQFMKKHFSGIDIRNNSFINYFIRRQCMSFCKEISLIFPENGFELKIYANKVESKRQIFCEKTEVEKVLGLSIPDSEYRHYLMLLGYKCEGDTMVIPDYRTDVSTIEDIAADIMRVSSLMEHKQVRLPPGCSNAVDFYTMRDIRYRLLGSGFDEVIMHPFTDLNENSIEQIKLKYCYSNKVIALREDMLTDLTALTERMHPAIGYFEVGKRFTKVDRSFFEEFVLSVAFKNNDNDLALMMNLMLELLDAETVENETDGGIIQWRFIKEDSVVGHARATVSENTCTVYAFDTDILRIAANHRNTPYKRTAGIEKQYSIDLPIACTPFDLRNHMRNISLDSMKMLSITVSSWKYNMLEKGKVWTCKMAVCFNIVNKTELKKFNKHLYEISQI